MASCHVLEGESDILPVTDGVLHLSYGHVTEGVSEKNKTKKLALMGSLHVAASAMVEFYSTCFEI